MADLNTEIKIAADASGVEAGVTKAKRSLADLGVTAKRAGRDAAEGMAGIGSGAAEAGQAVDRVTRNMVSSIQRQIAATQAGGAATRAYQESIARLRGANLDVLKPYLDQLDAAKSKAQSTAQANDKLGNSFSGLGAAAGLAAKAIAAIGITASVGEFFKLADASTNIASRLALVTTSAAELASVQQRLFDVAQNSRVSFADLVGTYAQVARSTKELGVSQSSLLGVIETISQAVTISGGSAASAQAALTQLSQGFASGALRGEELNSVLEQTPRLAQALADGLGVGIGQLREMGQAGELTAERVLGALENAAASVEDEFNRMTMTVEQASTKAANSVLKLVGALDKLTGVSSVASRAISSLSGAVDFLTSDLDKLSSQGALREAADDVLTLDRRATILRNGLANGFYGPNFQRELDAVNEKLAIAKQRFRELDQQLGGGRDPRDQSGFTPRSVSYANEAARQLKLREDANSFRLKQSGIPESYIKDMQELIRLNQAGVIVGDEYTAALKRQQETLLKKAGATKTSNDADKEATRSLQTQAKIYAELAGVSTSYFEELADAQKEFASGQVSQAQYVKYVEQLIQKQPFAIAQAREETAAIKDKVKAWEEEAKAQQQVLKTRQDAAKSVEDALEKARDEERAYVIAAASGRTLAEVMAELALARAEDNYQKAVSIGADGETLLALQREIEARKGLITVMQDRGVREANDKAADEAAKKWEQTSKLIGDTLADYIMGGGQDAAQYLKRLFATLVLRPVIETGVSGLLGAVGLGGGRSGSTLGAVSNASTLANLFGSGTMSAIGSGLGGTMSWANVAGSAYANMGGSFLAGDGISALLATNGAYGTAGAGAGALGGVGAAAGVLALPLLAGVIAGYLDKGDTFSGAAYASSSGNDRIAQVIAGALNPNVDTGDLPDRAALEARLRELGASNDNFAGLNDRVLQRMMLLAEGEISMDREGGPNLNWSEWGKVNSGLSDFYRGPGYAFPEQLGWWESQDKGSNDSARAWDSFYTDPAITAASRQLAEGILAPIMSISEALGGTDAFKVATGMGYNDKTGQIFGGLQVWQNDESVLNWGKREFDGQGDYLRATFSDALGAFESFDLPQWAQAQVESAQTALEGLSGDNMGEQAAQIYQQASAEIANTITAISRLITVVPELGGATQDAVFNIGQALGGLEQFTNAYSAYVQNFYSEAERFDYIRAGINDTLAEFDLSVTASTTREQFRAMVEAQDLLTESGQEAFAALLQVSGAFAEITPAAAEAVALMDELAARVESIGQSIGADLTSVLTEGLLGNLSSADLGGQMADVVIGGVYNALASNVGQQISDMMITTVVNPLLTAAMTGASLSEAVSQAAIDNMVANAQAAAQALNAVLASPEFQSALQSIQSAIGSISASMPTTPYYTSYASQVRIYESAVSSSASTAERAAESLKTAWASIFDSLTDEVKRIRGELADAGEQSMAYWQSQFAMDSAAARAGDEEAAKRLTEVSRSLLDAAGRESASMLDLQQMRAWVAQSLQDTAGYAQARAGGYLPAAPKQSTQTFSAVAPIAQAPIVVSADPGLIVEVRELRKMVEERLRLANDQQLEGLRIQRKWDSVGIPPERVET